MATALSQSSPLVAPSSWEAQRARRMSPRLLKSSPRPQLTSACYDDAAEDREAQWIATMINDDDSSDAEHGQTALPECEECNEDDEITDPIDTIVSYASPTLGGMAAAMGASILQFKSFVAAPEPIQNSMRDLLRRNIQAMTALARDADITMALMDIQGKNLVCVVKSDISTVLAFASYEVENRRGFLYELHINDIYVPPRNGLGTTLYRYVERACVRAGALIMELEHHCDNDRAAAFHLKNGFEYRIKDAARREMVKKVATKLEMNKVDLDDGRNA